MTFEGVSGRSQESSSSGGLLAVPGSRQCCPCSALGILVGGAACLSPPSPDSPALRGCAPAAGPSAAWHWALSTGFTCVISGGSPVSHPAPRSCTRGASQGIGLMEMSSRPVWAEGVLGWGQTEASGPLFCSLFCVGPLRALEVPPISPLLSRFVLLLVQPGPCLAMPLLMWRGFSPLGLCALSFL